MIKAIPVQFRRKVGLHYCALFPSLQTASPRFFRPFHGIQVSPPSVTASAYRRTVVFIGSTPVIPFEFNFLSLLLFAWYNISNKDLHCFGVALFGSLLICMV